MPDLPRGTVRAAGAVLWRPAASGVEVAVVHRPRYDDWSLPKGKRTPGEHILATATREVAEETGTRVTLGRRLSSTAYTASDGRPKLVDYWAATPVGQASAHTGSKAGAAPEVDDVAWLGLDAARDRVSYARDAGVLDSFAEGPRETTPLVLLRHAVALSRRAWRAAGHSDDRARPLVSAGEAQAALLADVLACYQPALVVSSSARRCLDTVAPYAAATGTVAEPEESFGLDRAGRLEDGHALSTAARQRLHAILARGRPAVLCAHRENLPALLAAACAELGAPVPAGPPLRKGAFWVLHVAAGRLACAERHQSRSVDVHGGRVGGPVT